MTKNRKKDTEKMIRQGICHVNQITSTKAVQKNTCLSNLGGIEHCQRLLNLTHTSQGQRVNAP